MEVPCWALRAVVAYSAKGETGHSAEFFFFFCVEFATSAFTAASFRSEATIADIDVDKSACFRFTVFFSDGDTTSLLEEGVSVETNPSDKM